MELCSIVSGLLRRPVTWGEREATATHACVQHAHGRAARARAQRDRTDGRYSIAVCRICSLCRDHVLVLIRAPDKIALCYRGSCLRDPRERERGREPPPVLLPTVCPPSRSSSLRLAFVLPALIRESSRERRMGCGKRERVRERGRPKIGENND